MSSEKLEVRRQFAAPWIIFWVALAVRLAYVVLAHTYRVHPYEDHFGFGWEMGRIARALATGYGYADPFRGHTGPTTWVTPAYPLIIAGVFKLFGIFSALSAFVLIAANCVLNALMVRTTWEIAARCFDTNVAKWSAWIWALYPAAMQYAVKWIWEMTLTAFLFSCVLALALRMRGIGEHRSTKASVKQWALFGLLWGLIALSNPSLLLFLPACGLWILWGAVKNQKAQLQLQIVGVVLASIVCLACIAPWIYRNWVAFHHFVPMRGNLGAELYLGNGPGATGLLMEYDHPFQDRAQLRLYAQMGELKYAKMRGDMAKAVIRANPKHFLVLCLKRVYYFWFSVPHPGDEGFVAEYGRSLNFQFTSITGLLGLLLALKRHAAGAVLFAWAFFLLPLVYYFVTVHARFRHPVEPLIAILSVYLFQSAEKSWQVRWLRTAPPMLDRYWKQRIKRHLGLAVLAFVMVAVAYMATPPPDVRHRASMATAYAALAFLALCMWLGPWNVLRRRRVPISFDLRRDVGIWAGALAVLHTAVGLTVHLRGRMWMYFFSKLHPLRIQNTQFGFANYVGLVAALLFVMLLVLSNDLSLRVLGTRKWKSLQRWIYAAFALTVAHGVAYQLVEKRRLPWVIVFAVLSAVVIVIQIAGFVRTRRARHGQPG